MTILELQPLQPRTLSQADGELPPCLWRLRRHDLAAAAGLPLARRFDTKFLLPVVSLGALLEALGEGYSVLAQDGCMTEEYENVYLDSADFRFYGQHHNRRLPRGKLRIRRYGHSGADFLELKVKNQDGSTSKRRTALVEGTSLQEYIALLARPMPEGSFEDLREVLRIGYRRISLLNESRRERISIDIDLRAAPAEGGQGWRLRDLAVVEVKQARMDRRSPAWAILRELGQRPGPFSKYCLSCALLFPEAVKRNRFKKLLRDLSPYIEIQQGETSYGPASA